MTNKKPTEKLIPGHARIAVSLYRGGKRFYGQAPGLSRSRIHVTSQRELNRLWKLIEDVVDGAAWRDMNQPAATKPAAATEAGAPAA